MHIGTGYRPLNGILNLKSHLKITFWCYRNVIVKLMINILFKSINGVVCIMRTYLRFSIEHIIIEFEIAD